jgi:hypothetical protein
MPVQALQLKPQHLATEVLALEPSEQVVWCLLLVLLWLGHSSAMILSQISARSSAEVRLEKTAQTIC